MKIFVNGCSHTALTNTEIIKVGNRKKISTRLIEKPSWSLGVKDYFNIKQLISYNCPLPFDAYDRTNEILPYGNHLLGSYVNINSNQNLSKHGNYIDYKKPFLVSYAADGKGNDSILFDTVYFLNEMEKNKVTIDYVVIQFSGPSRRLVSTSTDDFAFASPHDNTKYGLNFEPSASYATLKIMYILQNILNNKKIKYRFLNYFPLDDKMKNIKLLDEIDLDKFIQYKDNHVLFDGWINSIIEDGLSIDPQGHPNDELREIISNKVIDSINSDFKKIL